jgi:hypothetical protein
MGGELKEQLIDRHFFGSGSKLISAKEIQMVGELLDLMALILKFAEELRYQRLQRRDIGRQLSQIHRAVHGI